MRTFGRYDANLAVRLLGLDDARREAPRFTQYRGNPPLGADAEAPLRSLGAAAIRALAQHQPTALKSSEQAMSGIVQLARHTLEELASGLIELVLP